MKDCCEDNFSIVSESHQGKYDEESPVEPSTSVSEIGRHPHPITVLSPIAHIYFGPSLKMC